MKILFVADLHYSLRQFDWLSASAAKYSVVIIGGDLLDLASALDTDLQVVVVSKYLQRIAAQTRLMVCSGNHDGDGKSPAHESVARWLQEARAERLHVDGDGINIDRTLFTLCPWWDGPVSRLELEQYLERDAQKPKERWVWVHHAPPQNSPVSWTGRKFAGDKYLVEWINHYQPNLVLCGHVHNAPFYKEGSWVDRVGQTWVFNPGRQLGPRPTSLAFDLAANHVDWISIEARGSRELDLPLEGVAGNGNSGAVGEAQ